tara:strand:- start:493 stop:756 length:264 start_codon:yes stop_codon:yes gene_type:complete
MVGYIYIARSKYVLMTDEQGLATLAAAVKYDSVNVWHASAVTSIKKINYENLTLKANNSNTSCVIDLVVNDTKPRNTCQSIFKHNGK